MKKPDPIADSLRSYGRPMVSYGEIAKALGITQQTWYMRFHDFPELKKPPSMLAGGAQMTITDTAIEWCHQHIRDLEAAREAKRLEKKRAA